MGLMTETPWEYYQPPSNSTPSTDYHRENLKQLRKMQQLAKLKKEDEANKPMKAFALTEANKKKFDHVQSKVQEWVVSANSGRESSVKNFLKGHQKTGPFLEDNESGIKVKRLSGLRAGSKDKLLQASDYGTMSQSCQSVSVPPLNLDEDELDFEDLRRDVSLGYLGIGSRFSDITIDERKDRIKNLVDEIYNTCPLNVGNPTRKSLNQSIKRYASMDQVSDVESVITVQQRPNQRPKLSRHPSYNSAINRASSLRRFASSPKLTNRNISVQNLAPALSSASSMINIKAKKNSLEEHVNRHQPLRKNISAPSPKKVSTSSSVYSAEPKSPKKLSSASSVYSTEPKSPKKLSSASSVYSQQENDPKHSKKLSTTSQDSAEPLNEVDEDFQEQDVAEDDLDTIKDSEDLESLMIKGSDIDYVRANIHCASVIGRARRKEFEAAAEAEAERRKKKSESMKPPEKYKSGSVPRYLQSRQAAWKAEADRIEREKPDPDCPVGHRKLSDGDRREALGQMRERYKNLVAQSASFPVRADTLRLQKAKAEMEKEMASLEEAIRIYERPKVFVKIE